MRIVNRYTGVTQSRGYAAPEVTRALGEALDMCLPLQCTGSDLTERVATQVVRDFRPTGGVPACMIAASRWLTR